MVYFRYRRLYHTYITNKNVHKIILSIRIYMKISGHIKISNTYTDCNRDKILIKIFEYIYRGKTIWYSFYDIFI